MTLSCDREGFTGMAMLSALAVQSEPHFIYRILERLCQGGPR